MSPSPTLRSSTQGLRNHIGFGSRIDRGSINSGSESSQKSYGPASAETEDVSLLSDEELLRRYRDFRKPSDFAELFRRYSGALSRYIARYFDDPTLVEDVLQDIFLRVHAKCSLYREGWPARPWLYAVARHGAVNALRKARHLPTVRLDPVHEADDCGSLVELLAEDEPGPLEQLQEREQRQWVRDRVCRLPDRQRKTLELAYYEGLSYAEIAGLLGIPLGTVRSRLHGAITQLRAVAKRAD